MAYRMQMSAPELTDISDEPQHVLDMYGPDVTTPGTAAACCLLARRLVERGVRCVTIMHASWDHHSNLDAEISYNAGMLDQPAAALVKDLKRRGMLDETLVICAGEFGRTPLAENRGGSKQNTGRDHHPYGFSVWMAGGGVKGGQTYGATDDFGYRSVENRTQTADYHATILHLLGLDHDDLSYDHNGRSERLTDVYKARVIPELIS